MHTRNTHRMCMNVYVWVCIYVVVTTSASAHSNRKLMLTLSSRGGVSCVNGVCTANGNAKTDSRFHAPFFSYTFTNSTDVRGLSVLSHLAQILKLQPMRRQMMWMLIQMEMKYRFLNPEHLQAEDSVSILHAAVVVVVVGGGNKG